MDQTPATLYLKKLAAEQQPRIVKLNERVYVAVDYDVSTQTLIIGDDGVVIVDTGSDPSLVEPVLEEFRKISSKPIKGIIFTHGHPDHVNGAPTFVAGAAPDLQIWGRNNFNSENRIYIESGLIPLFRTRGGRQSGMQLPEDRRISNGVAPIRYARSGGFDAAIKPVSPSHTFADTAQVNVISVPISLHAAPGETNDQLAVWLPEDQILCCGDNIYHSFPNLYPVRGSAYRDVNVWLNSVRSLRQFPAQHMVSGHGMPFSGQAEVANVIDNYAEAISHVFTKTIEGMNQGLSPDELVLSVTLPPHLASLPYLQETYGNVAWSVRSIFAGYMGWFDGNPTTMNPLPPAALAAHMVDLVGGLPALEAKTREAFSAGHYQWAATLADHLLALEPHNHVYRTLKADALDHVSEAMLSATGRNYTASFAQQLRK